MQDFSDPTDSDYSDGQAYIANSYGYSRFDACTDCIEKIREDIEQERAEKLLSFYGRAGVV